MITVFLMHSLLLIKLCPIRIYKKALIAVMEVRSITGSTLFLRTAEHSVHDWDRRFNRPISPVTGKPYVRVVHLCEKMTASK